MSQILFDKIKILFNTLIKYFYIKYSQLGKIS